MRDDGCYVEVDEYKEDSQSNVDTTYSFSLPVAGRFNGTQVKGLYTRPLPGNKQKHITNAFLSCMGFELGSTCTQVQHSGQSYGKMSYNNTNLCVEFFHLFILFYFFYIYLFIYLFIFERERERISR